MAIFCTITFNSTSFFRIISKSLENLLIARASINLKYISLTKVLFGFVNFFKTGTEQYLHSTDIVTLSPTRKGLSVLKWEHTVPITYTSYLGIKKVMLLRLRIGSFHSGRTQKRHWFFICVFNEIMAIFISLEKNNRRVDSYFLKKYAYVRILHPSYSL